MRVKSGPINTYIAETDDVMTEDESGGKLVNKFVKGGGQETVMEEEWAAVCQGAETLGEGVPSQWVPQEASRDKPLHAPCTPHPPLQ